MRILITGGGCEEPIDTVRSICNFSTGATAAYLCDRLSEAGHEVLAILAHRATKPSCVIPVHPFRTFRDLETTLRSVLAEHSFGMIIQAAAVSDYGIGSVEIDGIAYLPGNFGKIASGSRVVLNLCEHPKIIDKLRQWSCYSDCTDYADCTDYPECTIVGFKLTTGANATEREVAIADLFQHSGIDLVVSNDLSEITRDRHPFRIYGTVFDGEFPERHPKDGRRISGDRYAQPNRNSPVSIQNLRLQTQGTTKEDLAAWLENLASSLEQSVETGNGHHKTGQRDTQGGCT